MQNSDLKWQSEIVACAKREVRSVLGAVSIPALKRCVLLTEKHPKLETAKVLMKSPTLAVVHLASWQPC